MPYKHQLNMLKAIPASDSAKLVTELDSLRAELDDIRAKYTALVALLVAGTALGAGYGTGTALKAATFKPT